jgi:transposase
MKLSTSKHSGSTTHALHIDATIACDVSKDDIHLVAQFGHNRIERNFANQTTHIEKELRHLKIVAQRCKCAQIRVVAEPTGNYHKTLFRTAERLELQTAYVSPEAVSKMRVIETNDSGKTDIKDPSVIHTLASIGKTLRHRSLAEPYSLLRQWNKIYDAADKCTVKAKGSIHTLIKELFPDFGMKKDFIFGKSGKAVMAKYKYNPYRICRSGKKRFQATMKRAVPRIRTTTLEKVFSQAQSSVKNKLSSRYAELIELQLTQRWQDLELGLERKQQAKEAMEQLYSEARLKDEKLPQALKGVITTFHLARIVAETGPLSDFESWRKLMRFSGYNLRERQSGKYRGKTKISKKGRRLLRKELNLCILPLIKKNGLYGPYYHRKKEKMPGTKAMTAVSRHFLKMLYGWYRTGCDFNAQRVFTCESQMKLAA